MDTAGNDYRAICQEARLLLLEGEPREAFRTFRPVLSYPGMVSEAPDLAEALHLLAQISQEMAGEEFAQLIHVVAKHLDDPQALYSLGYELIEYELHDLAATVLARAHALVPDEEQVLTEFVAALENDLFYAEAARVLRESPRILERSFLCRYLLAFNSIMIGNLETARTLAPDLQRSHNDDETRRFMAERIAAMLRRADALAGICPLDSRDLRGWHYVLMDAFLLHLSPYGFDEGMNGRYAYVHDSEALCLEGIRCVKAVLEAVTIAVPRVFLLPERKSAILAHALALEFGCPLVPWPEQGSIEPGLIAAYDLDDLDGPVLATLLEHRPGQVLWSHASCWTRTHPFAADLTTYLYQANVPAWEGGLIVKDAKEVVEDERDESQTEPPEVLAARLLKAQLEPEALDDLPALLALARAAAAQGDAAQGALWSAGNRNKQWAGSPVPGSRFL